VEMMDWNLVKKITLWDYEKLIKKISKVYSYDFIQEYYDHNMNNATYYVKKLLGYDVKYENYISRITDVFNNLNDLGVENYTDLIRRIENKEKCEIFLIKTQIPFEDLISTLNYIFRWFLPHNLYLRELIDIENESHKDNIEELRKHGIRFNLDILEHGRTRDDREQLSRETGIQNHFIVYLVNLADVSRLPYSNRKTVKHLFASGYTSITQLSKEDSKTIIEDMKSYFKRKGIKLSGFIDLKGIVQWAKTIPIIVKD
jgi:hypothetical protein